MINILILIQIVCEVVGVVITMAMLVPLCWMLADLVVIARMLMEPSPKQSFALYLYVIGWGKSLCSHACYMSSHMCRMSHGMFRTCSFSIVAVWDFNWDFGSC